MFHLTYVLRELRRRRARTILTSLGLALGVGLVIGIIGVSQGLADAQNRVLAPLSSVGTDILVTRVAGTTTATGGATPTPTAPTQPGPGGRGGGFFAGGPNGVGGIDQADVDALLAENRNLVTDLAKLGKPGEKFTKDFFLSATLLSFPDDALAKVRSVPGVTAAVGGLVQQAQHQTGTVPEIVAELQTGGQTITQTVRPAPMSAAEREAFEKCVDAQRGSAQPQAQPSPQPGGQPGGGRRQFDQCLPARFREFQAQFLIPLQTIRQVVAPPTTDITNTSYTAAAVDPLERSMGLVTDEQLTAGRWLDRAATDEVLLNVAYANTKSLRVGSVLPINGTDFKVVGLVSPTLTGSTADVYFPLATLQKMAGKEGRVTQVLVRASSADDVDRVAADIKKLMPGAEVVTTKALADQVTGSLASARKVADRIGGALAVIVLVAAFVIAVLLTLSSIAKRVREIGTLRAIGWSKGRVVRQLLGETLGIGLLGGIVGVGIGAAVAGAVGTWAPTLTATTGGVPGLGSSNLSRFFGQASAVAQTTSDVTLNAPLRPGTLLLGVGFALLGGLLAGLVGGWRAARLTPAVALRDIG